MSESGTHAKCRDEALRSACAVIRRSRHRRMTDWSLSGHS